MYTISSNLVKPSTVAQYVCAYIHNVMLCMQQSLPTHDDNVQSNAWCCSTTHEYFTQLVFAQNLVACCPDPCIWARYFMCTVIVLSWSVQSNHIAFCGRNVCMQCHIQTHSDTHGSCITIMVAATRLNTQSCSSVSDISNCLQHLKCWAMCGIEAIQARPRTCGPVEWCCSPCCSAGTPLKLGGGTLPTFRSSSKLARSCSLTASRQEM